MRDMSCKIVDISSLDCFPEWNFRHYKQPRVGIYFDDSDVKLIFFHHRRNNRLTKSSHYRSSNLRQSKRVCLVEIVENWIFIFRKIISEVFRHSVIFAVFWSIYKDYCHTSSAMKIKFFRCFITSLRESLRKTQIGTNGGHWRKN